MTTEISVFKTAEDQRGENREDYHNPTRQRGIYGDTGKTRPLNPSLTFRVGMDGNSQLQNLPMRLPEHQSIPSSLFGRYTRGNPHPCEHAKFAQLSSAILVSLCHHRRSSVVAPGDSCSHDPR